jgi:predicted transcriptional regulator
MPDTLMALVARIATPYVESRSLTVAEAGTAVRVIAETLQELAAERRPRRSETTECLHCSRRFRDLPQHVWREHAMTMERYQQWFAQAAE